MKKYIILLIFNMLSVTFLFSQNWFVGGDLGIRVYEREDRDTYTSIFISPIIGYKINKFDFGLYPMFSYEKNQYGNYKNDYFGLGIGLFSRYNIINKGNFSILLQISADYWGSFRYDEFIKSYHINQHSLSISAFPVFEYKLFDNFAIYSKIEGAYYICNFSGSGSFNSQTFEVSFLQNLNATIGFYFLF